MKRKEKTAGSSLVELVVIVAVALGLALGIQAFLVKPYRIPSESMVPTLEKHQRVLVNRIGNNFGDPSVGDIIVFHPPQGAESDQCGMANLPAGRICPTPTRDKDDVNYIKRVVGTPGDRIRIREGKVILNGKPLDEPYAQPCETPGAPCTYSGELTIPPDHYFMMGDNRGQSADSREWGPIRESWMIGQAFATYWPPGKVGGL